MLAVHDSKPPRPGVYVAYVNGRPALAAHAERIFLAWDGDKWAYPLSDVRYRDHVYGWVGPLPPMPLET